MGTTDAVDGTDTFHEIVVTVSEPAGVGPLSRRLGAIPGADVTRQRSRPGAGELGAAEVIQLLVPSSAVLAVAIRTLPAFIKSRRSSVTVKLTREDRTVTISGGNLDDPQRVLEIVERLLGDDERARDERALDE
ncbi:effector-associated constant component EACC1 [Streptomyces griseus]|uniref:effector-associated constant component EACC1 n=1 Tax=Streptomyces griseus TaxID=1911 RepID=UPI0033DADD68